MKPLLATSAAVLLSASLVACSDDDSNADSETGPVGSADLSDADNGPCSGGSTGAND